MREELKISEDVYQYIDNIKLEKENVKTLVEYVHHKSLLNLFTHIIENSKDDVEFLLPDYIDTISNIKILIEKIKNIQTP